MDPSSFVEKIRKDILSCSICSGILQNPKMLSCGHAFCKDCIETHFNVSQVGNAAKCPLCKNLFVFCKSGSKFLKQSLILRQLLDLFSEGSRPNSLSQHDFCKSAYHCEGKGIPTHYCPRCDKRMCNDCTNAHAHFQRDHDVSPINILENSQLIDENNCKCERHKGETLLIQCTTCDSLLCLQCKKNHEKFHSFKTVEEMKSEIKEIRVKLLHQKEKLERQQTENRTAETMFHTSASIAMEKMAKRYAALNNTLKTRKKELETDFQNHSLEFRKTFNRIIKDTETQLIKASNVIHLIDQLFSLGSERCLLESWKIIQEHLNVISNLESKENENIIKCGIKFKPIEGFEIGTIFKPKAYEHFGLFKEKEKLNEASSNDLESTGLQEDHIAGKEQNYQTRITSSDIVYENISSPRTSVTEYTENFDQATISEEMLGHRYTVLQQSHEEKCCGISESLSFDFVSDFETETGLSSEDKVRINCNPVNNRGSVIRVLESVLVCSTKAVISGAVFLSNNKLFAVSFKNDRIYVFDTLKWDKPTIKEVVKPFDVIGVPGNNQEEFTLVTCHRGKRQKCRIEKYRDGQFDCIFTENVTYPCGITFLEQTKKICVCESNPEKNVCNLKIFGVDGSCTNEISHPIFKCPTYIGVTSENELLVSDINARCVWRLRGYELGGNIVVFGESSEVEPKMSMWLDNCLFITGKNKTSIRVFDSLGSKIEELQIKKGNDLVFPSIFINSDKVLYCISDKGDIFKIIMQDNVYANYRYM